MKTETKTAQDNVDVSPTPHQAQPSEIAGTAVELKGISKPRGTTALASGIPIASFAEAWKMAEVMASSDLVPKDYRGKPQNVLVAMQHGAEVGLGPMQSVQNIAVVNGRPSVWGDAIMALCRAHPLYEWTQQWWDENERAAYTVMKRRGEDAHTVRFGFDDAKVAELVKKDTYKQYLEQMCRRRSLARCASFVYADALKGLAPADEVMDYIEGQATRVEPQAVSSGTLARMDAAAARISGKAQATAEKAGTTDGDSKAADTSGADGSVGPQEVQARIEAAASYDELNAAAKLIGQIPDELARADLRKVQNRRGRELREAAKGAGDEG